MSKTNPEIYLGDGVYVEFDGFGIILKANDHRNPTDTIALEPEVFNSLVRWVKNQTNLEVA